MRREKGTDTDKSTDTQDLNLDRFGWPTRNKNYPRMFNSNHVLPFYHGQDGFGRNKLELLSRYFVILFVAKTHKFRYSHCSFMMETREDTQKTEQSLAIFLVPLWLEKLAIYARLAQEFTDKYAFFFSRIFPLYLFLKAFIPEILN